MRVGVRVQKNDAKPVLLGGRHDHGKDARPDLGDFLGEDRPRDIGEPLQGGLVRLQGLLQRAADAILGEIDHTRHARPWTAFMAERHLIWRNGRFGLVGKSMRAGLARSTMLRS